jgi:uncharacterized protein
MLDAQTVDDPQAVLEGSLTVAVVGLSTNPDKAAHAVPAFLQQVGFRVIPVHPTADEILGVKAYRSLPDIPEPVDVVQVFRPAEEAPALARQAVAIHSGALWLQIGLRSKEARQITIDGGLSYVENRCMGKETALRGIRKRPPVT